MKVIAFDGSRGEKTATGEMIEHAFAMFEHSGISTEVIRISNERIEACSNCGYCSTHEGKCKKLDDAVNSWFSSMKEADGIILASHSCIGNMAAELKAFSDRATRIAMAPIASGKPSLLAGKVGGAFISVPGSCGAYSTSFHMMSFFANTQMIVPFAASINMAFTKPELDWKEDREGMFLVEGFTIRMINTMKRLHCADDK